MSNHSCDAKVELSLEGIEYKRRPQVPFSDPISSQPRSERR